MEGLTDEQLAIFSANNVKHIDAETFDSDRRGIYYSVLGGDFTKAWAERLYTHGSKRPTTRYRRHDRRVQRITRSWMAEI